MQLDRTCSRGLNRFAFVIDATLEGLNYAALRSNSGSSSKEEEALRHVLRDTLAGALGVPAGDVLLIRTWQGLDVHALIDSGPLSNKPHFLHAIETLRGSGPSGLASQLEAELRRQQKAAAAAKQLQQQQLQQQDAWGSLVLHRVPLLLDASLFTSRVSVPQSDLTITQIAFSSPGSSSSSRRQQQQQLPPEVGTWGLGKVTPRDVPCSTNQGLSAPPNTSVFEAYRLQSTADINAHGSIITVECGRGYTPVMGSSPQQLVCQQGRWAPLEASLGGASLGGPPERLLRCRKPCGPYEVADPLVLGPAFVSSGVGELDGDRRDVYCASGFVAAAASMPRTDTVVCTNGRWSRRQLECIKDFAAIADSSPCASALSLLPSSLRVETLQIGGGQQHGGAAGGPGVSTEVAAALNNTFQRAGVSLQLFRIGCARGFIAAALQQQQQQKPQVHQQQQQHQYTYAACKDGLLLDLGSDEPLPLGAFASGDAAEALVHQLKLKLDAAPYASTDAAAARAVAAASAGSSPAAPPVLLDGEAAAAAADMARGGGVMKGRDSGAPVLLGSSLGCMREVRHEPPKAPKPVSDTLLVFSCLLLLFVLVVALLAFWWYRSRRREKKAAKLHQQQQQQDEDADMRDDTSSGFGGGFSDPTERHPSSFLGRGGGSLAFAYGGGASHLQHHLNGNSTVVYGAPGGIPSHAYSLDADLQRGSHRAGGGLPPFVTSKEAAAAEAAAADEQSLALYAPVYYTGVSGDRGFPRGDREAAALAAAAAAQNGSSCLDSQAELLRRVQQQQQQQQMLLQQHGAALLATARRADLEPTESFEARSSRVSGGPSAAYLAAAAGPQQQFADELQQRGSRGSREEAGRRSSAMPAYPGSDAIQQQQQQQLPHAASRKMTGWEERGPQTVNESAVSSAEGHLSEDEELYPEDSASCVAMTAGQQRDAAAAAVGSSKGGSGKHRPPPRGQSSGKPPRVSVPSIRSIHRRHAHT
ncbi:hypothetical protein Esti_000392 [Eimeria stiedai]